MKKLLVIVVLGLLLSGNAYALFKSSSKYNGGKAEREGKIYIGQEKYEFCKKNNTGVTGEYMCWFSRKNSNNPNLYYYNYENKYI